MKLTLLLIPIVFLSSCTSNTEVSVTPNQEPTTIVDIHTATLNTYLKDVALYRATVRTMNPEKVIEDAQATYLIYSGTLSWTGCNGSEAWSDCTPPEFTAVIMGNDVAWFDEAVGPIACKNIDTIQNTEVIDYIRNSRCTGSSWTGNLTDTWKNIDIDFWNGFVLSQTDDATMLNHSGNTIKTWSHTPPENNPFVWDESCELLMSKITENWTGDISIQKQIVWKKLSREEKTSCIREYFRKSIQASTTTNNRFFLIQKFNYDSSEKWLYDILNAKLYTLPIDGSIKKIQTKENAIYVLSEWWRWNDGWVLLLSWEREPHKLFWNTEDTPTYVTTDDFELVWGNQMLIHYHETNDSTGTEEKKETTIKL